MNALRELAQLVDREDDFCPGVVQGVFARLVRLACAIGGQSEVRGEGAEALLGAVVKVVLEPSALGVRRLDEAGARGVEALQRTACVPTSAPPGRASRAPRRR
jgi:hypothetical protein